MRVAALASGALLAACSSPGTHDAGDGGIDASADGPGPNDGATDAGNLAGLPTLGGAPNTPHGRAIAAFVDTVIPGRHRDPVGTPGGIDVGAPAVFFDPTLPAAPLVALLVAALDGISRELFSGRTFERLSPSQREQVVEAGLTRASQLDFAVTLAKLAHYSADEAGVALGYPGANPGYVNDADFSFRRPMAREITGPGGNLP